jgi:translation initiation factor 1A
MPLSKNKGKRSKKKSSLLDNKDRKELVFKENGQEYAQIVKMLGNGRCLAYCFDGKKRLCHIRGKLRKRIWINAGDIVLVGLRDFQDEKCDILQKYNAEEAGNLKSYGEIPFNIIISDNRESEEDVKNSMNEQGFDFEIENEIN